ncbi:hypothetical protein V3C99_011127 [Haemonchus contortus]
MWFYYFVCLSLVLSFHESNAWRLGKVTEMKKCEDSPDFDCSSLKGTRLCFEGIFPEKMQRTCPKTCKMCEALGLAE